MTTLQTKALFESALPSNIRGEISAADLRTVLNVMADSLFNKETDRVEFANLSAAVLAAFSSGLDPTKYQGTWVPATNTPTIAAAGVGNTGHWYIASAAGTATGNAAGTYAQGDRIQSNGTAWLKQPAPPVSIPDMSITFDSLNSTLRDNFRPQFSPDYPYALVDAAGRMAFGIKPTGELFGKLPPPDGSITTAKIMDAAVTQVKLASDVSERVGSALEIETGYVWAIVDSVNRIGLGIKRDGTVVGKVSQAPGSITRAMLSTPVEELLPDAIENLSGYVWALVDVNNRIALGVTNSGALVGKLTLSPNSVQTSALVAGSVTEPKLSPDVARAAVPHGTPRFEVDAGDGWRGKRVAVPVRTSTSGSLFIEFSAMNVRSIMGINSTGTSLEFRRGAGLTIRGRRYRGTWDATTGSPDAAPLAGDWWNVTNAGTFGGVAYVVGDRLLALDTVVAQGAQYVKGMPGEMWYLGEFNPAAHTPSNIRDGDVWQASATGTFSSLTFAIGDLLVREQGTWGKITSAAVTTVAAGAFFSFDCRNAREIEVRRADKSTTRVGLLAYAVRTMKTDRSTDGIVMWGDSMVATGGLNTAIVALLNGRTFTAFSYPGASSEQILAMMRKEVRGADAYRGRFHAIFAATNNATDLAQTRECALAMADLAGARDNRVVFLSVIGQSQCGWNGTRITQSQFEDAFAKTGIIYDLEQWYSEAFPGCFINSRTELLARAPSTPALLFPGLTEAQAASNYGTLPLSFWLDYATKPWTPAGLTFTGYHSTAGLPTGGVDGDYKIRTANGTIGALQVRWAGSWTEHTWDITHMNATGNAAVAAAFASYLTANTI